jgi:DNA repair protein SbcC/Rad50
MSDDSKLRIKEVRIEGFRGVNRPVTLTCGEGATLLFAPNGQGKTSILGGIEWCLFGKLNFQPAENGTNDELVNLQHPRSSTKVELVLVGKGLKYVVSRERKMRKRETFLSVKASDGQELDGKEAEDYLFRVLGLTWEDFSRAVFLHQESVRGLLIDTPEIRDSALDRLFGLEKLRDVSHAIPMKVVTDAVQDVQHKSELATTRLEGAAEQVEQQREKYLGEAKERGFSEKDLTVEKGLALALAMNSKLDAVAAENRFELPAGAEAAALEDLERVSRRAKDATKQMRIAVAKASPAAETTAQIANLDLLEETLGGAETQLGDATKQLKDHEKEWGNQSKIGERKTTLSTEIDNLEHQLSVLGAQDRLLSSAIEFLDLEPHVKNCPVCLQTINVVKVAAELEARSQSAQAMEGKALTEKIKKSRQMLAQLEQALQSDIQLSKAQERAKAALDEIVHDITAVLPDATDPPKAKEAIKLALKGLHTQLDELNKFHAKREEKLQAIDDQVESLRAVDRFLRADQKYEKISAKAPESEEDDAMKQELDNLLRLQESLEGIGRAINEVAKSRASKAVEESREGVASFYKQLCNHPYFDGLRIEAEERNVRGVTRNTYTIRAVATEDGKETLASSRLSTGQMNCVAVSIYLALTRILSHRLGFVILDDPSQNLDTQHKVALAKLLKELQPTTQLLVATEDTELQGILRDQLGGAGTASYDLTWNSRNGTTLSPA